MLMEADGLVHTGVVPLLIKLFRWAEMLPMVMDVSFEELLRSLVSRALVTATPARREPGKAAKPAESALGTGGAVGARMVREPVMVTHECHKDLR